MIHMAYSSNVYMGLASRKCGLLCRSCIIPQLEYWKNQTKFKQVRKTKQLSLIGDLKQLFPSQCHMHMYQPFHWQGCLYGQCFHK